MIAIALALLATPDFPSVIQQQLALQQPPRCTVCHATDSGGTGTVVKPFGVYLQSRGLVGGDESSLRNALLADAGEHHSSDGGKTTDIDALRAGTDPNGTSAGLVPAYGCSSFPAPGALGLLALLLLRLKRSANSSLREETRCAR